MKGAHNLPRLLRFLIGGRLVIGRDLLSLRWILLCLSRQAAYPCNPLRSCQGRHGTSL